MLGPWILQLNPKNALLLCMAIGWCRSYCTFAIAIAITTILVLWSTNRIHMGCICFLKVIEPLKPNPSISQYPWQLHLQFSIALVLIVGNVGTCLLIKKWLQLFKNMCWHMVSISFVSVPIDASTDLICTESMC